MKKKVPLADSAPAWPPEAKNEPEVAPEPQLQYTNQSNVQLDYRISTIGPSGVGLVELWATEDNGLTWHRFAEDVDRKPPFDVRLPAEGTYGFTLVIRSRAGLGGKPPQSGQLPDLRIEYDATAPEAVLYSVEADPDRKDALFLHWSASDRNLAETPISLFWAERPEGPWQPIAVDLPNTGRHEWRMPPELPYRVYLRLEVRDRAGNVSVAETPEPVLVDLTEPEAELIGIVKPKQP